MKWEKAPSPSNVAEPVRGQVVTRKLSECRFCGDLIFQEEWSNEWRHNRNGSKWCSGRRPPEEAQA